LKSVLFRVDGNKSLGMGHLSRCIQLAKLLKKKGVTSYFLIKKNNISISYIISFGFRFFILPNQISESQEIIEIKKLKKKFEIGLIFIDLRKTLSKEYFKKLKKTVKIIVIDNYEESSLQADLIIWPWSDLKELKRNIPSEFRKKILTGQEYMILGKISKGKARKKSSRTLLISMGGSDKSGITLRLIRSLKKSKIDLKMKVVTGKFFKDSKNLQNAIKNDRRFSIIKDPDSLIPLMKSSYIGIFTFGITTYEALYVGIPSMILTHSLQNNIYAKLLSKNNCIEYLGYFKKIHYKEIPNRIKMLQNNRKRREEMINIGKKFVDGKGKNRITNKILELLEIS
jgi:spore coat polysaccharide biosynthesis predicted glycosyltransferase SpsG